jgi:hypothetical protein
MRKLCLSVCFIFKTSPRNALAFVTTVIHYNFISALSEQLYYARPTINTIIHFISKNIVKNIHKALINMDSFLMTYASV